MFEIEIICNGCGVPLRFNKIGPSYCPECKTKYLIDKNKEVYNISSNPVILVKSFEIEKDRIEDYEWELKDEELSQF